MNATRNQNIEDRLERIEQRLGINENTTLAGPGHTPNVKLPSLGSNPKRRMLIEILVDADFEKRLDNQWMVEREIHADRWSWKWATEETMANNPIICPHCGEPHHPNYKKEYCSRCDKVLESNPFCPTARSAKDASPFPFQCENCGHKPTAQEVLDHHGDCAKCRDTVITYTVDAAACIVSQGHRPATEHHIANARRITDILGDLKHQGADTNLLSELRDRIDDAILPND